MTKRKEDAKDEVGMLWQDTQTKEPEKFLRIAVDYYKKKYGKTPTSIHVNSKLKYERDFYDGISLIIDSSMYHTSLVWIK